MTKGTVAVETATINTDKAGVPLVACPGAGEWGVVEVSENPDEMQQDKPINANDWKYDEISADENRVVVKTRGKGNTGSYGARLDIRDLRNIFIIYVHRRLDFPPTVAERSVAFLTHANYGLTCGKFELNMNDGDVRYKNSIYVAGSFLSSEMTNTMIHTALSTMNKYFKAIVKAAYGVMFPQRMPSRKSKVEKCCKYTYTLTHWRGGF